MRYRVTQARVLTGYDKCSYQYDAGAELDDATAPEDHVSRLMAAGVLEPIAEAPPEDMRPASASGRARPRLARAGEPKDEA
ncbi:hypothetical protein [Phreatobacter sp.]|uniref:hypothetical protein n=1 Tax=Phreatobacter sp. TaxID=1966341 RepID=UPI003F7264B8